MWWVFSLGVVFCYLIFFDVVNDLVKTLWRKPKYRSLQGLKQWRIEFGTNPCAHTDCKNRIDKNPFRHHDYCIKHEYIYWQAHDDKEREKRIQKHLKNLEERREAALRYRQKYATTYRVAEENAEDIDQVEEYVRESDPDFHKERPWE